MIIIKLGLNIVGNIGFLKRILENLASKASDQAINKVFEYILSIETNNNICYKIARWN